MIISKKTIILMRHADALPATNHKDIDRKLSLKGINQAENAGSFLSKFKIDKSLVSPAIRTLKTLEIVQQQTQIINVEILEDIYKEGADKIIEIITFQPHNLSSLMIVGHNPSICSVAFDLIKPTDKTYDYLMNSLMPPATVLVISLPINNWNQLESNLGDVTAIFIAK